MEKLKTHKSFDGQTCFYEHDSVNTNTKMKFSTFFPSSEESADHCIIWLSGLTCTEENFITKSGVQEYLSGTKAMILCPDTSPRGLNLDNEHENYDFGSGASFYINATTEGYKDYYKMYDYIVNEVTGLAKDRFKVKTFSIMGHSMGGHGALVLGLREKELFKSVSAFSPIVNPSKCPWGVKALTGYLGESKSDWCKYDAVELLKAGVTRDDTVFIDQGLKDEFLEKELLTRNFIEAATDRGQKVIVKYREGYDHSYYYISSFIKEHIKFHLTP